MLGAGSQNGDNLPYPTLAETCKVARKDLFDLSGRTAIVTGVSSGLGVTFCEALAEAGADLAVCARRVEMMEKTAQMVRALGRRCLAVKADVTDPGQIDAFVDQVMAEYGKIDILVNNAGVSLFEAKSATDANFQAFDAIMETNVTGSAMLAHRVGREMLARGYGRIINLSSVLGVVGGVPQGPSWAYSISKHSVVGLTRACAIQWADRGVTVNALAPGYFPSEQSLVGGNPDEDEIKYRTPMRRQGRPDELKTALLFLAAKDSSFITGQTIVVDGGWSVW